MKTAAKPTTKALLWFRQYCKEIDDPRIRLIAAEDRWHYQALKMLKGQGLLDAGIEPGLLQRQIAVKLGVQLRELDEIARRLGEVQLIDPATYQPLDWDTEQFRSDSDPTAFERKRRQRELEKLKKQDLRKVTPLSRVTVTNVTRTETETETDKDLSSSSLKLDWSYLTGFDEHDRGLITEALGIAPAMKHQDVLDEFTGAWQKGVIKKAWADWFEGVCKNAAKDDFRVRHGRSIQADRRKKNAAAETERERLRALADAEARRNDPDLRARNNAAARKAREEVFGKRSGDHAFQSA